MTTEPIQYVVYKSEKKQETFGGHIILGGTWDLGTWKFWNLEKGGVTKLNVIFVESETIGFDDGLQKQKRTIDIL